MKSEFKGAPPVYVARKYSDFTELDKKLRKEFPGKSLPKLPAKHKSSGAYNETGTNSNNSTRRESLDEENDYESDSESRDSSVNTNGSRLKSKKSLGHILRPFSSPRDTDNQQVSLAREKQRVTLRGYVRELVKFGDVTRSHSFMEFFFKDKIPTLNPTELKDIDRRRHMDLTRLDQQLKFFEIASQRARELEVHLTQFKQDILQRDGLYKVFQELKQNAKVENLSPRLQKFVEWAEVEIAATLYHMLVADDTAPEMFSQVKRMHHLFPYTILRGILRWSNPVVIMKGVIDLFLAQPFGKRSLLQSLFWMILEDDIKSQQKLINELKIKINNSELIDILDIYVESSFEIKEKLNNIAHTEKIDIIAVIFQNSSLFTRPSWVQQTVSRWYSEWDKAADGLDDVNTSEVDSYTRLKEYYLLAVRRHDKDQMQKFWADETAMRFIKKLVTLFYSPLITIFKLANLPETVTDAENFMDDVIAVVLKTGNSDLDPNHTVQEFITLCERHHDSFFKFIHNVYANDNGLFDEITKWMGQIIEFLRYGNGNKLDMSGLLQEANVDIPRISQEIDALIAWTDEQRQWKKEPENNSTVLDKLWETALPSGGLGTSDFGMNSDDLDTLYVSDEEPEEESNSLEAEQRRRKRLVQKISEEKNTSRPEITDMNRLEPIFHQKMIQIFQN